MKIKALLALLLTIFFVSIAAAENQTTIRQIGKTEGLWGSQGSQNMLGAAKVTIRNVGQVEAKDVRVQVEVPGLGAYVLNGPSTLRPNQRVTYGAKIMKYVKPGAHLETSISCSNCR